VLVRKLGISIAYPSSGKPLEQAEILAHPTVQGFQTAFLQDAFLFGGNAI
jgi:hypothetical protein